jgi:putative spermidine/putrescine transport system permease protein
MSGPAFGARTPGVIETLQTESEKRGRQRRWTKLVWWVVFLAGVLYFVVPLWGTLDFALKSKPFGSAFGAVINDPKVYQTLAYSFIAGLITIVVSVILVVPTAFWVRLRYPRIRPYVEFITLLPFVIPAVVLVFGLLHTYGGQSPLTLGNSDTGLNILLICAYVVLSFPYMYRSVDAGLRTIDVHSLTEASQSLGAGWLRILVQVILPNLRTAVLSGAFLTLAIVIGEFTIATFLSRAAFAPYLAIVGDEKPYEQAALALIAFGLTWIAMILIAVIGRRSRTQIKVTVG